MKSCQRYQIWGGELYWTENQPIKKYNKWIRYFLTMVSGTLFLKKKNRSSLMEYVFGKKTQARGHRVWLFKWGRSSNACIKCRYWFDKDRKYSQSSSFCNNSSVHYIRYVDHNISWFHKSHTLCCCLVYLLYSFSRLEVCDSKNNGTRYHVQKNHKKGA